MYTSVCQATNRPKGFGVNLITYQKFAQKRKGGGVIQLSFPSSKQGKRLQFNFTKINQI